MQKLNEQQQKAVTTTEGYIRVISGAGTGKTRIITNRYVHLVNELGIANQNILCVTFTNNASKEMKHRIDKMIKDKDVGYICTFHSLSTKALREDIHCVGIVPNFTVMDKEDQNLMMKRIYKKLGITNKEYHYQEMRDMISQIKSKQESISDSISTINYIEYLGSDGSGYPLLQGDTIVEKFFNEYIEEQRKNSMLDYNDLINIFLYILMKYADKRSKWQKRFQYIMCDEFNDIDRKQYQMLYILSQYHKNLMIVGDPDQTIYSWRGSDVNYIINFSKDFENVQDIIVNTNYRSVPSILNVANSLIRHNRNRIEKDLIPFRTGGDRVVFNSLKSPQDEAKWIADKIEQLKENGENLSDIAILYRNNALSRRIEEELIFKNINYNIYSGVDFYSRKEIKDILSYLRFILYEKDVDFQRIINTPPRRIGDKAMEEIFAYSKNNNCSLYESLKALLDGGHLTKSKGKDFVKLIEDLKHKYSEMSVLDVVNEVLKRSGYQEELDKHNEEERIENIEELKHGIIEFIRADLEEKTLEEYLDKISLYTDNDRTSKENAVKLMTIHGSKGLEFKNVFVISINDGILPSAKIKTFEGIEEERRLFYVAITRAKDRLFLTDTQINFDSENPTSRFLKELDQEEIEFVNQQSKDRISTEVKKTNVEYNIDGIDFKVGDVVTHFVFGKGTIEQVDIENKTYGIKFEKFETIRNISMHIKLEKLEDEEI